MARVRRDGMANDGGRAVTRRGMTLVEVVAALVLLATLAGAIVPLLQSSARALAPAPSAPDLVRLGDFAARLLTDPRALGLTEEALSAGTLNQQLPCPGGPSVRVTRLEAGADHAWLIFECGNAVIARWVFVERGAGR